MNATHASYKVKSKANHIINIFIFLACMDRTGAVLKVGQSRTFDDGENVTCFEEDGKIRLRITTSTSDEKIELPCGSCENC